MLGHSHAMSGLAVGALVLPLAPLVGVGPGSIGEQLAWVAAWGGFALLPDLDQGGMRWRGAMPRLSGSTVARMWGPLTTTVASGVSVIARGHRQGTHDVLLAPLVFALLAVAAATAAWSAVLVLALAIGLALQACHAVVPGRIATTVLGNLVVSFGAAWWLVRSGTVSLGWLPWAVAGGVVVHIAGDLLTVGGVPVPLTWISGRSRRVSLRLFRTGAAVEHWLAGFFGTAALLLVLTRTPAIGPVEDAIHALLAGLGVGRPS